MPRFAFDVFVSHSSIDKEVAIDLATRLRKDGLKVWLDEWTIQPGDMIPLKIEDGLQRSRTLVLIMSANAFASEWVGLERHTALFRDPTNSQRRFVPVRIDESEAKHMLAQFSHIDWRNRSDEAYAKLLTSCRPPARKTGTPKENAVEEKIARQQQRIHIGISEQQQSLQQSSELQPTTTRRRVIGERPSRLVEHFRDRDMQRAELMRLLASPATRIVSIVGRGGSGKTAIASKVLVDLESSFEMHNGSELELKGIVYLSTRTGGITLERIFHDAARLLDGDREVALVRVWTNGLLPVADRIERLLQELNDGAYIFLLDNFEKLLDEDGQLSDAEVAAFIEATLNSRGGVRLLITTRTPIRLAPKLMRFNRVVNLDDGLPVNDGITILRELDPNNDCLLRDAPEAELAEAVKRVYGLPRALEVLVGLLNENKFLTIDELLPHFYKQETVLETLAEFSYRRLDLTAQRALQALAVYERPVPAVAVDFMLEPFHPGLNITEVLRQLERVQMIHIDRAAKRCYLHPIDRELAYDALPQDGEFSRISLERRAADYYRRLRTSRDRWYKIDDLEPQLREFEHLVRAGDEEAAALVLSEIDVPWLIWSGYAERVQSMWGRLDGKLQKPHLEALRDYALGHVHLVLGPFATAEIFFRRAHERARAAGDEALTLECGGEIGETLRRRGKYEESEPYIRDLIASYHAAGNVREEAKWLFTLSLVHVSVGNTALAIEENEQALKLGKEIGEAWLEARAYNGFSLAYLRDRQSAAAEQHAKNAIDFYAAANSLDGPAYLYNMIGVARMQTGDLAGAKWHFEQAVEKGHETGQPRIESIALLNLALLHRMGDEPGAGLEGARRAVTLTTRMGAAEQPAADAMVRLLETPENPAEERNVALRQYAIAALPAPDLFIEMSWCNEAASAS